MWETEMDTYDDNPFALRRLASPGSVSDFDISGMGPSPTTIRRYFNTPDSNRLSMVHTEIFRDADGRIPVKNLTMQQFRQKLINHFNLSFHKHEVQWPQRIAKKHKPNFLE